MSKSWSGTLDWAILDLNTSSDWFIQIILKSKEIQNSRNFSIPKWAACEYEKAYHQTTKISKKVCAVESAVDQESIFVSRTNYLCRSL